MTVDRQPEMVYVLNTLVEEALRIKRANTPDRSSLSYLTNIETVVRPPYGPDDTEMLLLLKRPALALWPVGLGRGEQMSGERRFRFKVRWIGLVDATSAENGQDRALCLLDDLYRMMTANPGRDRPSGSANANPYGVGTSDQGELAIVMGYENAQENQLVVLFDGLFDIDLRSPW